MLLFKGMEEFRNVVEHSKQRHHIIGQYVLAREHLVQDAGAKDQGMSEYLKNFYSSNYFWSLSSLLWIHLMWGFAFGCRLQINMISNLYCNLLLDNDQLLFVSGHLKTLMLSKTGSFAENETRKLCLWYHYCPFCIRGSFVWLPESLKAYIIWLPSGRSIWMESPSLLSYASISICLHQSLVLVRCLIWLWKCLESQFLVLFL